MNKPEARLKAFFVAALLSVWTTIACAAELQQIPLSVGSHKLTAEVASDDAQRSIGLMHRRMLPENRGMLFVFADIALHGMWMKNTYLPLSVAFLDREGVIINIVDMQPHVEKSHNATRPARYALEMNQGWFKKRGVKAGDKVEGLEKAEPGR